MSAPATDARGGARDAGRVVIVGGGIAGFGVARELRALGHDGPITIVEAERACYDRPPLSKRLFDASFTLDDLAFASPDELDALRIEVRAARRATALDTAALAVELDDGARLEADTIVLATGGRARTLAIPGADAEGVLVLRTFADARAVRERVEAARARAAADGAARGGTREAMAHVVVVGAGLIGAELASSLVDAGARVTLVDPVAVPLVPAVGERMAAHLHDMHGPRGVATLVGVAAAIEQGASGGDAVSADDARPLAVLLDDGRRLPADAVVVGVGIVPNIELAEAAGLDVDGGIIVDERFATSAPGVYAVGDVARRRGRDGTLERREEHWEAARLGGAAVARAVLGRDPEPRGAPWFWSDRHGVHLEATGRLTGPGEHVERAGAHPAVLLVDDGVLVGAATVDDPQTVRAARRLIDRGIAVSTATLADPAVSLRTLVRDATARSRA